MIATTHLADAPVTAAIAFLKRLHPNGPWALTAIAVDRKGIETRTFGPNTEAEARAWITHWNGKRNLYYSLNRPCRDLTSKAAVEDIAEVIAFHVDLDPRAGEPLEAEQARLLRSVAADRPDSVPAPTMVIASGGGIQVLWVLAEPITIADNADLLTRYNKQLELILGGDCCHDLCRILRLPGTENLPDAKKVAKGRQRATARVICDSGIAHSLDRFTPAPAEGVSKTTGAVDWARAGRLASVDDLAEFNVPERIRVVIVQGDHPDEPKLGDNSRSAWLFDVCCNLVRCRVPDEVIYSIITDPDFKISVSVLERGSRAKEYATRQIRRAHDEVENHPITRAGARPQIVVNARQLRDIIADAWSVLLPVAAEIRLFRGAGGLVRIVDTDGGPQIQLLDEAGIFGLLVRQADWIARRGPKVSDAKPPRELARDLLALPDPALPALEAIVTTPVFTPQGRLLQTPGYDPASRLWYEPTVGLALPDVPATPSEGEVAEAIRLLTKELFVDFSFAAESDEAHVLAALLLPFARRLIPGCTPIHDIEGTTPGSGKGLLADTVSIVARGRPCDATTLTRDENETRKKLTALLVRGTPIVLLDNIRNELDSAQLAAALTADMWSDRILGQTRMVDLPNRATWLLTGNNPKLSLEIARRSIRIRLEPGDERPWERAGFKHDPLREWVLQERPRLVWAVLVLIQNWLAKGRPPGTRRLGSFECWAATMGGILQCAGVCDFLKDTTAFYEAADSEGEEWRALIDAWAELHGGKWTTVSDLLTLAQSHELLGALIGDKSEQSQRVRLAKALRGQRDRQYGRWKVAIERNSNTKNMHYRLAAEGDQPDVGDADEGDQPDWDAGAEQLDLRWVEAR